MAIDAAEPFASSADLFAAFPSLADEGERADVLLPLVSAAVRAACDWEAVDPEVLRLVTVQATARMLQAGSEAPIGASQTSWTASPFGGSTTYANPSGDVYLTAFERRLLGADVGIAFYVNQEVGE